MKLLEVQKKLKAPKNQRNSFGNYNYRSAEDILEAVKPLLAEAGLTMTITDSIEAIGGRVYVKATVTIKGDAEPVVVSAFARESETKKGMDASQITGAASSYARKYALNGMFLIDDTKDADTMDNTTDPVQDIVIAFETAESMARLKQIWDRSVKYHKHPDVIAAKDARKKELTNGN